jgi:hypothetical protein
MTQGRGSCNQTEERVVERGAQPSTGRAGFFFEKEVD